jgi:hypothetical protein
MEVSNWLAANWFDLLQTLGIVGGLLFTAYAIRKDEKGRKIGNLIAINQQHHEIWKALYGRPELARVLKKEANVNSTPISDAERLFVNSLILQLSTVYRAMKEGMFVPLEGLKEDIKGFFTLPIPKNIWEKIKPLQDKDFAAFVENVLRVVEK